ncbi:MAG: hypothetical protein OCD00_06600 [Colwellia sp.]
MANKNKENQSANLAGTDNADENYQTVLIGEADKLSTKSTGKIGFEIALNVKSKLKFLRITTNASGGLFSRCWVSVTDIAQLLEKIEADKPFKSFKSFKSSIFKPVISGGSSNNVSFLSAILRCPLVGFIQPSPSSLFLHVVNPDLAKQVAIIEKLTPIDDKATARNNAKPSSGRNSKK